MSERSSISWFPPPPEGEERSGSSPTPPWPPPGTPRRRRRWIPALIVVVVMLATVFGGYVVAAAIQTPTGAPVDVGGLVRIQPASGWESAGALQAPPDVHAEGLTRGSGNLAVYAAGPYEGTPVQLAGSYAEQVLEPRAEHISESGPVVVQLSSTIEAVRFGYVGIFEGVSSPIEGEVTVVVSPSGTGVVYDGWAPEGQLQDSLGQIHAMEEEAVVT